MRTSELSALESRCDSICVTDCTTSSVDEPCSLGKCQTYDSMNAEGRSDLLEMLEKLGVNEALCTLVQRAVHGDNITLK